MSLLPPDHPDAPKYWMKETSGEVASAMIPYLNGKNLTPNQVGIMKAYLWQWIASPVWRGGAELEQLRQQVLKISNYRELNECIEAAIEMNMDPL